MGKVYRAYDPQLERVVAIKIIDGEQEIDRQKKQIIKEAKSAARLHHANIVQIYEIGDDGNNAYLVMEYVCGSTLADHLSKGVPDCRWSLCLLRDVAQAVHYAHREGIIHRDLKPTNIMLDQENKVKLMDFGLAKVMGVQTSTSTEGMMVGTAYYMPPEQVNAEKVDRRSDVYALGAVLYEMLTGQRPFCGQTTLDIAMKILTRPPTLPRDINTVIPQEVELICLKCLQKKREERYASAQSLARDIERYLECRPIIARSANPSYRVNKWVHRNFSMKRAMMASLVVIIISLVVANFCLLQRLHSSRQRNLPTHSNRQTPAKNGTNATQPPVEKITVAARKTALAGSEYVRSALGHLWQTVGQKGYNFKEINIRLGQLQKLAPEYYLLYEHWGRICLIYALKKRGLRNVLLSQAWQCVEQALTIQPQCRSSRFLAYQLANFQPDQWRQRRLFYRSSLAESGREYYNYFLAQSLSEKFSPVKPDKLLLQQGIDCCQQALAVQRDFAPAWLLLAKFYRDSGDYRQALTFCLRALHKLTDIANPFCPEKAQKKTLYFLTPMYLEALLLKTRLAQKLNKNGMAVDCLTQVLSYNPSDYSSYLLRGEIFSQSNDHKAAIDDFSLALHCGAPAAVCYQWRCRSYLATKQYYLALNDSYALVQVQPKQKESYLLRAKVYQTMKKYRQSWRDLEQALALTPQGQKKLFLRSNIYRLLQQKTRSVLDDRANGKK